MENHPLDYRPELIFEYAGFWKRFIAHIIDGFVLLLIGYSISKLNKDTYILGLLDMLVSFFYYVGLESSEKQATLGKLVMNIKVTDTNGRRIGFGQATIRYLGKILSGFLLMIGYLMVAFTEKKQGLHDLIAKTYVIQDKN